MAVMKVGVAARVCEAVGVRGVGERAISGVRVRVRVEVPRKPLGVLLAVRVTVAVRVAVRVKVGLGVEVGPLQLSPMAGAGPVPSMRTLVTLMVVEEFPVMYRNTFGRVSLRLKVTPEPGNEVVPHSPSIAVVAPLKLYHTLVVAM